ncbi:MAG: hypothetical protein NXI26_27125, partial [bacterium]|nr:hypothetical protein [bacterium]
MKYSAVFITTFLYSVTIFLFTSCEKISPQPENRSNASYHLNGLDGALWKGASARQSYYLKDTFDLSIQASEKGLVKRTISLDHLLIKEGIQEISGIRKLGSTDNNSPAASVRTISDDGHDFLILDWYYLDTSAVDNWVNIIQYNEETQFIQGTFQFTAIRDTVFV